MVESKKNHLKQIIYIVDGPWWYIYLHLVEKNDWITLDGPYVPFKHLKTPVKVIYSRVETPKKWSHRKKSWKKLGCPWELVTR